MGMSTRVIGLRNIDSPEHQKKLTAVKALLDAGISIVPQELKDYFGTEYAEDILNEPDSALEVKIPLRPWKAYMREGFEVDLSDLPEGVQFIRFYNSW